MSDYDEAKPLEMLSHMLRWSLDGLDWAAGPESLSVDAACNVIWSTQPTIGGAVKIKHKCSLLPLASLQDLANIATALAECAQLVDRYSALRAGFESDMRKAAKTLLRRKTAAQITLVDAVSEPIPTDYRSVGMEIVFAWRVDDHSGTATFQVSDADSLSAKFEELLGRLEGVPRPLAA